MSVMLQMARSPTPSCQFGSDGGTGDQAAQEHGSPGLGTFRGRVLIVDDDEAVRETLAELLDDAGFCIVQAGGAADALMILRQNAIIDALVTDLTMPGDDGITLIREARKINNDLPALLLTGYAEQATSVSTIAGGNFHVLRKPVECGRLIEQLELLLGRPSAERQAGAMN